jgi:isoleucyl-tRNA synthetase
LGHEHLVTRVEARPADAVPAATDGEARLWVRVTPTTAAKCVRCWHKRDDVGSVATHPELCGRCVVNLDGTGEIRRFA